MSLPISLTGKLGNQTNTVIANFLFSNYDIDILTASIKAFKIIKEYNIENNNNMSENEINILIDNLKTIQFEI